MNIVRLAKWGAGLLLIGTIGLYITFVAQTRRESPLLLLSCMKVDPPLTAWTCRQVLLHGSFQPEDVAQLNRQAGARYALDFPDPAVAEKMLALFIAQGVDINAVDENANNWTALYGTIADGDAEHIRLLLRHGARLDVRDTNGISPLEFAHRQQQKYPNDPQRTEIVKLLEASIKK